MAVQQKKAHGMLSQYSLAAVIVGPIVWAFFRAYFQAKQNGTRRSLFLGMLCGLVIAMWLCAVFYAGYAGVFQ